MENKKILLIGGGGHCRSVLDCLLEQNRYGEIGIIEKNTASGLTVLGIPVVGTDEDLEKLFQAGWTNAFITIGSIGNANRRRGLLDTLRKIGFSIPPIVDGSAIIGREVSIAAGTFVGKGAVVNVGAQIETAAIINTGAVVEHDCYVGDFAHISSGAVLCGEAYVGQGSHIGAGSVVRQQIRVGSGALVGAGSVVVNELPDCCVAYGNPCKVVKTL